MAEQQKICRRLREPLLRLEDEEQGVPPAKPSSGYTRFALADDPLGPNDNRHLEKQTTMDIRGWVYVLILLCQIDFQTSAAVMLYNASRCLC